MIHMTKMRYTPPEADFSVYACCDMLALSGYNDDNNTEYIDYEYGDII